MQEKTIAKYKNCSQSYAQSNKNVKFLNFADSVLVIGITKCNKLNKCQTAIHIEILYMYVRLTGDINNSSNNNKYIIVDLSTKS